MASSAPGHMHLDSLLYESPHLPCKASIYAASRLAHALQSPAPFPHSFQVKGSMTKLHLLNTASGKTEAFDTVDATEILEAPGSIYTLLDPQPLADGPAARAGRASINVPQLHGDEPGTSSDHGIAKYARQAVTKGVS